MWVHNGWPNVFHFPGASRSVARPCRLGGPGALLYWLSANSDGLVNSVAFCPCCLIYKSQPPLSISSDSNFQIQFLARRGRTTSTTYNPSTVLTKQSVASEGKYHAYIPSVSYLRINNKGTY